MIIPRQISYPDLATLPFIEGRKRNFLRECPRWSNKGSATAIVTVPHDLAQGRSSAAR
jgi:hypothetical protein